MSETTNLKLFKHDNPSTNENQFDVTEALNNNWDKIDDFAGKTNDTVIEIQDDVEELQGDNTTNKQDIANLKTENEELKAENERLNQDLNALPSNTAEGEYITLTDSADSRFNKFKVIGKSTQKVTELGANVWSDNTTRTFDSSHRVQSVNLKPNIKAGTYKFSCDISNLVLGTNTGLHLASEIVYEDDSTDVSFYLIPFNAIKENTRYSNSITIEKNIKSISLKVGATQTTNGGSMTVSNFCLRADDSDEYVEFVPDSPSPDYKSDIQNITDNIDIISCNENLALDGYSTPKTDTDFYSSVSSNFTPLEDGWGRFVGNNTNGDSNLYTNAFISFKKFKNIIKPNTAYRLLAEFRNVNMSGNTGGDYMCLVTGGGTEPFQYYQLYKSSLSQNSKFSVKLNPYLYETTLQHLFRSFLSVSPGNSTSLEVRISLLEENSTETEVKVGNQEFIFPLAEGQVLRERDYLADDGIHHKRNTVSFNGTENWKYDSTYNRWHIAALVLYNSVVGAGKAELQCNYFKYSNSTQDLNKISDASSSDWYFYIEDKYLNGKTFPEWLQEKNSEGNPLTVEYNIVENKLNEYVEAYTDEQKQVYDEIVKTAKTYKTVTNIFSTNEVSPKFEVNYRRDIDTYIDNKLANVNEQILNIAGGN